MELFCFKMSVAEDVLKSKRSGGPVYENRGWGKVEPILFLLRNQRPKRSFTLTLYFCTLLGSMSPNFVRILLPVHRVWQKNLPFNFTNMLPLTVLMKFAQYVRLHLPNKCNVSWICLPFAECYLTKKLLILLEQKSCTKNVGEIDPWKFHCTLFHSTILVSILCKRCNNFFRVKRQHHF